VSAASVTLTVGALFIQRFAGPRSLGPWSAAGEDEPQLDVPCRDRFLATPDALLARDGQTRIDTIAGKVPEMGEGQSVPAELGLTEEEVEAVVATLDANRLAWGVGDERICLVLVDAAEQLLKSKQASGSGVGARRMRHDPRAVW
jgi:hypothetical protein